MRCAFATLRFMPAMLCGLLVVAWVVSEWADCGVSFRLAGAGVDRGSFRFWCNGLPHRFSHFYAGHSTPSASWLGRAATTFYGESHYFVPIPFLLTLLLPLAIGPFIRFRYPLWTWFALTALVAVELAFYLR